MKISRILASFAAIALAIGSLAAETPEKTPAFPGAEGFGRYTTGGRGGAVYHVTNLRDDNSNGSLRWALAQPGPRNIVFDVSGTIHLTSTLNIPDNTTIAGQTAPGDGICVADYPFQVRGKNVIVRFMRIRLGNKNVLVNGADGWDGFGGFDTSDLMIDHCSISWSIDECCSFLGNYRTTVQWCLVAQSLVNSGHTKGAHGYGGNWGGSGASFHHNLVIHHTSRTPRLGPRPTTQLDERMDYRNNVIYNWGGNGCYGGEGMNVNIVNNYYKPGPGTPSGAKGMRIASVGIRTNKYVTENPSYAPALHLWGTFFVEGNVNTKYPNVTADNWTYGMYNQIDTSASATDGTWNDQVKEDIRLSEPISYAYVLTHTAEDAYARVMDYVGASLSRDSFDDLMIYDCENGKASHTGSGLSKGFINSQEDNRPAGAADDWSAWPTLMSETAPVDTDRDGMPDDWEKANGLNPNNGADGRQLCADGYTNFEHYINSLVAHITEGQAEGAVAMGDIQNTDPIPDYYLVDNTTKEASWSFGNNISISNNDGANYTQQGTFIGLARDVQHTLTLPAGAYIYRVEFTGRGRYTGSNYSDASLVELDGMNFDEGVYTLSKTATADKPDTFSVDLPRSASGSLTMTWKGNNPYCSIRLYASSQPGSGVSDITADDVNLPVRFYNLQGIEVEPDTPGLVICSDGTKRFNH